MKTCLLFTANDPQLGASHLMTTTLRARERGAYEGDICVLSTDLSDRAKEYLDRMNIRYFVDDMAWVERAIDWSTIFQGLPKRTILEKLTTYRNKRMSKLIFLDWHARHGKNYDVVAVTDNDLYFQGPVADIFSLATNGKINYAQEDNPIFPGSSLWMKDAAYRQITGNWNHQSGSHEINIGFMTALPNVMAELFQGIRERFAKLPPALIRDANWHDQDLARVLRCQHPEMFEEFPADTILHLCGGGMSLVEERLPGQFVNRISGHEPRIVHFGGGAWKDFATIAPSYKVNSQVIFSDITQMPAVSDKIAISNVVVDRKSGTLAVNGWYASNHPNVTVLLSVGDSSALRKPAIGIPRPDIVKQYADERLTIGGWEITMRLGRVKAGQVLTATLLSGMGSTIAKGQVPAVTSEPKTSKT